jgi:hypothetical protein
VKNKLQKWFEVVDVDASKLCCHCYCEMAKVIHSVLCCSNNECGITIDVISMVQGTFFCYWRRWFREREMSWTILPFKKLKTRIIFLYEFIV